MKFKSKIAITFMAVVITLLGFSLMISPVAVELAKTGQEVNLKITYNENGGTDATLHHFCLVVG